MKNSWKNPGFPVERAVAQHTLLWYKLFLYGFKTQIKSIHKSKYGRK